jgi:hypothetical protein
MLAGGHPATLRQFVLAQGRWRALHPPAKTPFTCQHKLFVAYEKGKKEHLKEENC